jgi:hypothetical protein
LPGIDLSIRKADAHLPAGPILVYSKRAGGVNSMIFFIQHILFTLKNSFEQCMDTINTGAVPTYAERFVMPYINKLA